MNKLAWVLILGCLFGVVFAGTGSEPVRISADKVSGDSEKKIAYIEGNVRIVQGQTVITTENLIVNLAQKTAILDRRTKLANPDVTIESGHLEYNLKQKTGTFRNQVLLKRFETHNAVKDPFELTATELYFESDTKDFKSSGNCHLKHKQFDGKADSVEYDDTGQKLDFKGSVVIQQDAAIIKTENAVIDLAQKQLRLETKTDMTSRETNITAAGLSYNYEKKTGTFTQDVVLTRAEVKNTNGKITKDAFTLKAASLYFETDSNNFTANNARIEHKDFNGTADKIDYNDKLQRLTFHGNAHLIRPHSEELNGEQIEISLPDQSFTVHQSGAVKLLIQEEK